MYVKQQFCTKIKDDFNNWNFFELYWYVMLSRVIKGFDPWLNFSFPFLMLKPSLPGICLYIWSTNKLRGRNTFNFWSIMWSFYSQLHHCESVTAILLTYLLCFFLFNLQLGRGSLSQHFNHWISSILELNPIFKPWIGPKRKEMTWKGWYYDVL